MPLSEGFKNAVAVGSSLGSGGPSPIELKWEDIEDLFSPELWERIEKATNSLPIHASAPQLYVKWGNDDERDFPEVPSEISPRWAISVGGWNLIYSDFAVLVQPTPDQGAGPAMFWFGPVWTRGDEPFDKARHLGTPNDPNFKTPEGYDREPMDEFTMGPCDGSEPDKNYTNQDQEGPTVFKGKDGKYYR